VHVASAAFLMVGFTISFPTLASTHRARMSP
jgi:hypothetical protein